MGIYAKGEQLPATRVSDTPQDRYGELADPNDIGGSALGQVIADTKATASSANDTAGAVADDLSALESRVDNIESNGGGAHTHVSADITDTTWQTGDPANAGKVVRLHGTDGWLYAYFNPTHPSHLARKLYVDQQVDNHDHVSADITDTTPFTDSTAGAVGRIPVTGSDGFLHSRDNPTRDSALARKGYVDQQVGNHAHTADDITGKTGWVDSTFGEAGRIPVTGSGGYLYSRDNPTSDNHLARKGYVDQRVSNHTHTSANISDRVTYADADSPAGRVVQTGNDGFIHSRTNPTSNNHLARRGYIVQEINNVVQQIANHTHTSANITDTTPFTDSTMGVAGRIPTTGSDGFLHSRDNPTRDSALTRKAYVDEAVATVSGDLSALDTRVGATEAVTSISGTGWSAYKRAGVVTLSFSNMDTATANIVLPEGFRPGATCYFPITYSRDSVGARFNISTGGGVTFIGDMPNTVFTTVTYVAVN